jgi:hypothetical protein
MAATGFTPISLYYSATTTNVPLAANLTAGELALNTADGKLFYKDSSNVVQVIGTKGGVGSSATTQVLYNSAGLVVGSANMTFNGTTLTSTFSGAIGATTPAAGTFTTATATSFTGPHNGTVGATTPSTGSFTVMTASADSAFTSTGAVQLSAGTTAQRPTGVAGKLRFNSDLIQFEGYTGTAWASVGGATLSNDTTTATFEYPLFASATSGSATTVYTSNAKLLYKPSTGELQSSGITALNGLVFNANTLVASTTVATGFNASTVGPFTVPSGLAVTVSSGSRWVIL